MEPSITRVADLPQPEPPPEIAEDSTERFVEEVCDEIAVLEQYHDKTIKPAEINIVFDNNIAYNSTEVHDRSTDDSWVDYNLNTRDEEEHNTTNGVINTIQSVYPTEKWKPGLNNIIEETDFQVQQTTNNGHKELYFITSAK